MPSRESIAKNLAHAELEFRAVAHRVPSDRWKTCPGAGRWSAGELVCHLITVERLLVERAGRLVENPPRPRVFRKRFHVPLLLVATRLIPRKTPIPLDARLLSEKDAMLAQLREVRARTLVFLEETAGKDLGQYHMPHPFLGTLNLYEWFQMIAYHQVRHTKQLKEIAAALLKTVNKLA